jgi:hypothetical protein
MVMGGVLHEASMLVLVQEWQSLFLITTSSTDQGIADKNNFIHESLVGQ